MFISIHISSANEAVSIEVQQNMDNVQIGIDKWKVTSKPPSGNDHLQQESVHSLLFHIITIIESPVINILGAQY